MRTFHYDLDLEDALHLPPGYHGTTWFELDPTSSVISLEHPRETPTTLVAFLLGVARAAAELDVDLRFGTAYLRVIDGGAPENYMNWHVDNEDGGVRFHTAIATDDARVNLAWPKSDDVANQPVEETWNDVEYDQPANGELVAFTTELHGVLPQLPRPGEATIVFFATLYTSREAADLYTTNNTATSGHGTLPALEPTR